MLGVLEIGCWRNMQRISQTERKTNEDILIHIPIVEQKLTLTDTKSKGDGFSTGHTLMHGKEMV